MERDNPYDDDYENNVVEEERFSDDEAQQEIIDEQLEQISMQFSLDKEYSNIKRPEPDSKYIPGQIQNIDLTFLEIEVDYYEADIDSQPEQSGQSQQCQKQQNYQQKEQGTQQQQREHITEPIIRIYGVTKDQNSVMVHVKGFEPYFWVECPRNMQLTQKDLEAIKQIINQRAESIQRVGRGKKAIKRIEIHNKESLIKFKGIGNQQTQFLKIFTFMPSYVAGLRSFFERGFEYQDKVFPNQTYESNMPFALRFMIDKGMVGMNWLTLTPHKYTLRTRKTQKSRCQLEADIHHQDIQVLKPEGIWQQIPPLRILSIDIECVAKGFPQAEKDPVITICCVCKTQYEEEPKIKTVFALRECSDIIGAHVQSFKDEKELLLQFQKFFQVYDPDFILGYNTINFDFPYLINRAKTLKEKNFGLFSRNVGVVSRIKDTKFLSKVMGMRETKEINMEGRVQLDMMIHMFREHKLSSYSLNSVSFEFLNQQKEDVHHSIMLDLFNGSPETRRRIASYCLKDAYLPMKLMDKLMCLYNYTEMARVTGVPINMLFTRGQQIKVASQLYRKAKEVDLLIPSMRSQRGEDTFEGASVLEPEKGYYQDPIATLDFASLYPSIMMAHNICYTTLILQNDIKQFGEHSQDIFKTPSNHYFVKSNLRKGLLPSILEELITARKKAKADLKNETDPFQRAVLDGRQNALKISANSVYGFTGAQAGQLPCLEISSSVTAIGRDMILKTKETVLKEYTRQNGYENDAQVIYGDTDSVMIKFGVKDLGEAMRLGREAAERISQQFIQPIKLEFEKVYYPYLLINRKRYAGLLWTKTDKYDKLDKKGIESVRRDNCYLIRHMMDTILKQILIDRKVDEAINYTKNMISDLLQNKIDLSWLIITKGITKKIGEQEEEEDDNKNKPKKKALQTNNNNSSSSQQQGDDSKVKGNQYKSKQAHVELAEKMRKRDAANAPNIGDRIQYIMVTGTKGSRNYENAEDPSYVLDNDCPIDFQYYLEKQLKTPLMRIFELTVSNPVSLFIGEHTRNVYIPKVSTKAGGLGNFVKVGLKCLSCQVPINYGAVCDSCDKKGKTSEAYLIKLYELKRLQTEYNELWTQCQRCQGNLHQDVICSNRDCGIFYRRRKAQKDLNSLNKVLERFNNDW